MLPFVLIFMLLLINNKELMGEYVNSKIAWTIVIVMVALTLDIVVTSVM